MEIPDLTRIVDTYVPVATNDLTGYLAQLKRDVLPEIRRLESDKRLRWYAFLLHDSVQLGGREPDGDGLFIHIRLEPAQGLEMDQFIKHLSGHFFNPRVTQLSPIQDLDSDSLSSAAHAWFIHGKSSEWVLALLEGHKAEPSLKNIIQFLHYSTNPIMLGHRCICVPGGYASF